MKIVSEKVLLNLKEEDLTVEEYYIDMYYAEVKLKCGLYVYWSGHSNESYENEEFSFTGSLKNLLVMDKSYEDISSEEEKFIFTTKYIVFCRKMDNIEETDAKYLIREKIAKNITKKSGAEILFYELKDYTWELINECKAESARIFELDREQIYAAMEKVKMLKTPEIEDLSNRNDFYINKTET